MCERELKTEQNCNILALTLLAITVFLSRSLVLLNRGPEGPLCLVLVSLPHLVSNGSGLQTHWLMSSPSYIIVQSPTQYLPITGHRNVSLPLSLEWHVWLSSNENNCHAVHRSLSSGASVWLYRGILPCPILSAKPAYANGICVFRVFGIACLAGSKVNIEHCLMLDTLFGASNSLQEYSRRILYPKVKA